MIKTIKAGKSFSNDGKLNGIMENYATRWFLDQLSPAKLKYLIPMLEFNGYSKNEIKVYRSAMTCILTMATGCCAAAAGLSTLPRWRAETEDCVGVGPGLWYRTWTGILTEVIRRFSWSIIKGFFRSSPIVDSSLIFSRKLFYLTAWSFLTKWKCLVGNRLGWKSPFLLGDCP